MFVASQDFRVLSAAIAEPGPVTLLNQGLNVRYEPRSGLSSDGKRLYGAC